MHIILKLLQFGDLMVILFMTKRTQTKRQLNTDLFNVFVVNKSLRPRQQQQQRPRQQQQQ